MKLATALKYMLCVFAINSVLAGAADAGGNNIFGAERVRENVFKYLETVLGKGDPTLADFYGYESAHNMAERHLELGECRRRWGEPHVTVDGRIVVQKDCRHWLEDRARNARTTHSLYYSRLRKELGAPLIDSRVTALMRPNEPHAAYLITVVTRNAKFTIELYHAADLEHADLGLMGVLKINGTPVNKFLSVPTMP